MSRKTVHVLAAALLTVGLIGGMVASSDFSQDGARLATGICCSPR
jgi:hypothetical protein